MCYEIRLNIVCTCRFHLSYGIEGGEGREGQGCGGREKVRARRGKVYTCM